MFVFNVCFDSMERMCYYIFKENVNVALNQLSKMREQLDKKTEDLGLPGLQDSDEDVGSNPGGGNNRRRQSSIWEGLAEWMKLNDPAGDDLIFGIIKKLLILHLKADRTTNSKSKALFVLECTSERYLHG